MAQQEEKPVLASPASGSALDDGKKTPTNAKEERFFNALKNIFIGPPVEGESGYINLMRFKARYFEKVMMPHLQKKINEELQPFPDFREELFDKLYTFFRRYFTESGSLGFFFTPYHQSVYEHVYTEARDVFLFWKTARLYYVKTDRLFRSMLVKVDNFDFFFDVSGLEHKKANEKQGLVFTFQQRRSDGVFVFKVAYSERGRQTRMEEIRQAIRKALGLSHCTDAVPSEETLERAFRLFARQSEVDYFICKDARSFLRKQFDLWMWQYLLGKPGEEPKTHWTEKRLKEMKQAMLYEQGRVPEGVSAEGRSLGILSQCPKSGSVRLVEVKGRASVRPGPLHPTIKQRNACGKSIGSTWSSTARPAHTSFRCRTRCAWTGSP